MDQDEPASEQDVRLLARRCDAPARRTHPTHPLSPRGFADGDGPAPSTGDPDPESQKELFSRLDRNAPAPALLAAIRVGCANTRRTTAAAFANVQEGGTLTRPHCSGVVVVGILTPQCTSMFIDLAGSELQLSTGTTQAPPPRPAGSLEQRLSLRLFVQTLAPELDLDPILGPILRGSAVASGRLVDRNCAPVTDPARTLNGAA